MKSRQLPGKPLALIRGRPMLQWVYERTRACSALAGAYVATCDGQIRDAAAAFGAPVIVTSSQHERAIEETAEAVEQVDADLVVMVQDDEPTVVPEMIESVIEPFDRPDVVCVNLATAIETSEEFVDRNAVKVVFGRDRNALYFSRQPIPTCVPYRSRFAYRQVGVTGFRREFLRSYTQLCPTTAEMAESIDLLRVLEHGYPIRIVPTLYVSHPVDTEADLRKVDRMLAQPRVR